jgi:hypothetical protein
MLDNAVAVAADTVFRGCQMNLSHIRSAGPALGYITSLPASGAPIIVSGDTSRRPVTGDNRTTPAMQVTHVLINNRAYPLNGSMLYLSANGAVSSTQNENSHCSVRLKDQVAELRPQNNLAVFVNGSRITGVVTARSGDTVSFAGADTTIRFIEVTGD